MGSEDYSDDPYHEEWRQYRKEIKEAMKSADPIRYRLLKASGQLDKDVDKWFRFIDSAYYNGLGHVPIDNNDFIRNERYRHYAGRSHAARAFNDVIDTIRTRWSDY